MSILKFLVFCTEVPVHMVINRNRSVGPNMYAGPRKSAFYELNKVIFFAIREADIIAFSAPPVSIFRATERPQHTRTHTTHTRTHTHAHFVCGLPAPTKINFPGILRFFIFCTKSCTKSCTESCTGF